MATDSILDGTKKALGIAAEDHSFDADIIMHINSTFATLNQLGIGPVDGFMIEDAVPVWSTYLSGNKTLNSVKSYMYLKVRSLFDPPVSGIAVTSMEKQILEYEWRLNVVREGDPVLAGEFVFDGGTP